MILRPDYINAIEPFIDSPIVKILAGVRRCGKSTILEMVADELIKHGSSKENIIERRYNEIMYEVSFPSAAFFMASAASGLLSSRAI